MSRVALVTCRVLPEPDPDEALLVEAIRDEGLDVELLPWDDPGRSAAEFDLCVLRSCWNYHEAPDAFLDWVAAAAASSRVLNPPAVIRWNVHKRYLNELARRGVSVVPTLGVARGEPIDWDAVTTGRGWSDVVVKPAISAASFRTRRFRGDELEEGRTFAARLARERDVLVQPYVPSVEGPGERALVWIDGRFTHAVRKSPRFADGAEQVSGALEISAAERELAERALSLVEGELLYARVDVVTGEDGRPLLSELELMEPSLFLKQEPAARARFARAIRREATS